VRRHNYIRNSQYSSFYRALARDTQFALRLRRSLPLLLFHPDARKKLLWTLERPLKREFDPKSKAYS
jgi:hypothetical protein